jgi:hypothetical protein
MNLRPVFCAAPAKLRRALEVLLRSSILWKSKEKFLKGILEVSAQIQVYTCGA